MFELRVLDGLHQGAALPLFGGQWLIGAHPDADLSLYDEGIAERHVLLRCIEQRWSVQAEEGLVRAGDGRLLAQIADLMASSCWKNNPHAIRAIGAAIDPAGDLHELPLICQGVQAFRRPEPSRRHCSVLRLLQKLRLIDQVQAQGLTARRVIGPASDLDKPPATVL